MSPLVVQWNCKCSEADGGFSSVVAFSFSSVVALVCCHR